ncbi:uncharacterized protein IWZ02DRAFT_432298 [Phyllosticta citriasiana]|uniref:uncharacterized protein n=1 Tax=Phyllosticta citriasiana TaxID=595635 RepID=UPI0030FDD4CC
MIRIIFILLALAAALASVSAIPQGPNEIDKPQKEEGDNANFCNGVIGFSKVLIAGKGSPREERLNPKQRIKITKPMIVDAVAACRQNLQSECKMIICNLYSGQVNNNPCGSSSHPPTLENVNPDSHNGDHEFFDPACAT